MTEHQPCRVCPAMLNEMKKGAILIGTLARIGRYERLNSPARAAVRWNDKFGPVAEKGNDVKLITERTQVREVSAMWANSYPPNGPYGRDPNKQAIAKALAALDAETATAADVAAIIGNDSWCRPSTCHECGAVVDVAVQVGEDPDYESSTATLCLACVEKALALMGPNAELRGDGPASPARRPA